ncbi:dihydrofolate synthetase Fol3 [Metarhizium album ARSEF 1941]|uniref:Dihydrofolate synthetase Fol3 n=1 Tax=Metarhizium album (strain ARSEF 1941) TaxID=1081103 RepID=A0A0B2WLL6_METAS|nr:dihydrofolate synthetase Fol3 [Metarhizium album ARSEF 1941]KHN94813.1 dihydrofolate synthetase Fol3 [Metarhizium album ARSEF 1941]
MPAARDIQRALARIRAVMPAQKQSEMGRRNIKLGLERISRVVPDEQKWVGVHVGGTNGKGSICALLAGMFKLSGISHGTYISPALPERHNGITINGLYINKRMYEMELQHVEEAYKRVASGWTFAAGDDPGDLTPFELETAAAFRVFNKMNVQYGIVEVGMGGATDATNAMKEKAVTIISKIDLDHQEYLGNTIEEIAKVKAGIMRPGVPCIVDHTNPSSVMDVLRDHAQSVGTQLSLSSKALPFLDCLDNDRFQLQDYEQQNILCAALAFRNLFPHLHIDVNKLLSLKPHLPGRMEQVYVRGLTDDTRQSPVLVDGAHNMLGVEALAKYVDGSLRHTSKPVTWVIGLSSSKSKPFSRIIETLIQPHDNLAFVEYAQGPNDPPPAPAELGRSVATQVIQDESRIYDGEPSVGSGVQWACRKAGEGPVVVTGSLYMIRDFYKMEGVEPSRKVKTRRPGRSQLWRYIQLSKERPLTSDEAREFKQARRHWYLSPMNSSVFRDVRNGGDPVSPPIPESIRKQQQAAAHHKIQADGYGGAIRSARKDMEGKAPGSEELPNMLDNLEKRHREHLRAYNSAMFKVRGHVVDPEKRYLSHEDIFRRPDRRRSRVAAILAGETTAPVEKPQLSKRQVFKGWTRKGSRSRRQSEEGGVQRSLSLGQCEEEAREIGENQDFAHTTDRSKTQ